MAPHAVITETSPPPSLVKCPICFEEDGGATTFVELQCSHALCEPCMSKASSAGFAECPICRNPHLLDASKLKERRDAFRASYGAWRSGGVKGAFGELAGIILPLPSPQTGTRPTPAGGVVHNSSAGDLALLGETVPGPVSPFARPPTPYPHGAILGFAIVGMGRAGKIHLNVLHARGDVNLRWLVDTKPDACPQTCATARITTSLDTALSDPAVDCVIVSTPTPHHAPIIRRALEAGKHVFAEKPLCCDPREVAPLFALAAEKGRLLFTAYNRRHDHAILAAREQIRAATKGRVLGAQLVSRDHPYPPAEYLALSGNLFKDCVVHDLDYLTWALDDEVLALRAHASTSGAPRAMGMWEYSTVQLELASGAAATLVNCRVAPSYDHRLDVYCEEGAVHVANPQPGAKGLAFSDRFANSYHAQIAEFVEAACAVAKGAEPAPNLSLERTLLLDQMVAACELSVARGGERIRLDELPDVLTDSSPPPPIDSHPAAEAVHDTSTEPTRALRSYDDHTALRVREHYRRMRENQSVEHVRRLRAKYVAPGALGTVRMSVWVAMERLSTFIDVSDPDLTLPNLVHAFQTAEGLRAANLPDWMQLTGLIHDCGKMVFVRGCDEDGTSVAEQWAIVGDTWIVGCAMPDDLVFPEFNAASPDAAHPERTTATGIYEPGCGLDQTMCAFGHDEYMYEVLRQNPGVTLPKEALYIIRYHSLYPWHDRGGYAELESDEDRAMKGWVKLFNQHDLYTKRDVAYSAAELDELRSYYTTLIDKYLPEELDW